VADIRVGGVYATFRARNEQFIRASRQNVAAIRRQRQAARELRSGLRRLSGTFSFLGRASTVALGSALFAGASAGLSNLGRSSAKLGADLRETASTIGVTVAELQTLGRVFAGGGASQEIFAKGLRTFQRNLVQAQLGLESYRREFRLVGIDVDALRDQGVTGLDAFLRFADALRRTEAQTVRLSAAQTLMGRSGAALLNVLQEGRAAIEGQAAAFASLGTLTDGQVDRLKRLEQSYTDTGDQIRTRIAAITADNADLFDSFNRIARSAIPRAFAGVVEALELLRSNMALVRAGAAVLTVALLRWSGVFRIAAAAAAATVAALRGLAGGAGLAAAALVRLRAALVRTGVLALAVALGEAVYRFSLLRSAVGSAGAAFSLLGDAAAEALGRLQTRFALLAAHATLFARRMQDAVLAGAAGAAEAATRQVARIIAAFTAAYEAVRAVWRRLPEVFAAAMSGAAGAVRRAAVAAVNAVLSAINRVSAAISGSGLAQALDISIGQIDLLDYPAIEIEVTGRLRSIGAEAREAFAEALNRETTLGEGLVAGLSQLSQRSHAQLLGYIERLNESLEAPSPALERLREAISATATTMDSSLRSLDTAAHGSIASLESAAQAAAESSTAVADSVFTVADDLRQRLDSVYSSSVDRVSSLLTGAITGMESLGDAAKNIARSIISEILSAYIRSGILNLLGGLGFSLPGGISGFQHGGLARRGLALVGEAGPEIVDFRSPGRVYTSDELAGAVGGGRSMTFNFSPVVQSSDSAAVSRALADAYPIFEDRIRQTVIQDLHRPSPLSRR